MTGSLAPITLITASRPDREVSLARAIRSVHRQSIKPQTHIIGVDYAGRGPVPVWNALARAAQTEWLSFLDDDDTLFPNHFGVIADEIARDEADVIYTFCEVKGRGTWSPNMLFDEATLRKHNYIPITATVRRAHFLSVGGFPNGGAPREDWGLWLRLLDSGARFIGVPTITWWYNFHGDNRSLQ